MLKSQTMDSLFKMIVTKEDEENIASSSQPGKCLENPSTDENVVHVQSSDQIMKNRLCLKTSISILRYLTFQDLAFSGDGETSEERNQNTFLSMVDLAAKCDDEVSKVVLENASYLSKVTSLEFQKVILHIFSSKVKNHIREEIGDSKFCIVVDEVYDGPKMALVLRFVDKNGFIQERFFDTVRVKKEVRPLPLALKEEVCAILSRHNLDVSNIRGQGYDGTSNMKEQWNDLRTLFLNECPYAYHIHGFGDKLEHVLVGASSEVFPIHQFFLNLSCIVNFFCSCRKPHDELLDAKLYEIAHSLDNNEPEFGEREDQFCIMQQVDDALSRSYFSPICNLINMYDAACCLLEKLIDDKSDYCQRGEAYIAFDKLITFEFVLILHLMRDIMGITGDLCRALQQQSLDVVNVRHLLRSTKALLQNMGQDGWDKLLKKVTSFCEKNDIEVPQMNAPYVTIPRRRAPQNEDRITIEHYYKERVFFIAIDKQVQELNRFSDQGIELLALSSALVPKDNYKAFNIDHICTIVEKYYPMDFNEQEKINIRCQLEHFIIDARQDSNLKNLLTIQDLCACLAATKKSEVYYLIDRLLRLIMTLPVSKPKTERSSSAMRVFKTMLNEKMEDEFLPDSMIIYMEREIAKSFSIDSIIDDLESLEERNDSQLCSSVNGYINKPLELHGEEESDGSVPLQVADAMVEDNISSRAADLSVTDLGVEATSNVLRKGLLDFSEFGIGPSKYKFTVLSFLEAFEDSVSKSEESRQDDQDLRS